MYRAICVVWLPHRIREVGHGAVFIFSGTAGCVYDEVPDMTFGCMACALSKFWFVVAVCE